MKVISYKDPVIINGKKISDPSEYLSADGINIVTTNHPLIVNGKKLSKKSDYLSANGGDFFDADGFSVDDFSLAPDFVGNRYGFNGSKDDFYDADGEAYSYIDKNNPTEVRAFQDWLDAKGLKWVGATNSTRTNGSALNKGVGYGTFGPSTTAAYNVYGAEWEATRTASATPSAPPVPITVVTQNVPSVPAGAQPTTAQIEEQKKKGVFWDKAKRVWITAKDSGLLNVLANWFGLGPKPQAQPTAAPMPAAPEGRKMSKGLQTGLIIGGVVVLGLVIYAFAKKK